MKIIGGEEDIDIGNVEVGLPLAIHLDNENEN